MQQPQTKKAKKQRQRPPKGWLPRRWFFFKRWCRWRIETWMVPDFWTTKNRGYIRRKRRVYEKNRAFEQADKARRQEIMQAEIVRLSGLTYKQRVAEEVERERAFVISMLNKQRGIIEKEKEEEAKKAKKKPAKIVILLRRTKKRVFILARRIFYFIVRAVRYGFIKPFIAFLGLIRAVLLAPLRLINAFVQVFFLQPPLDLLLVSLRLVVVFVQAFFLQPALDLLFVLLRFVLVFLRLGVGWLKKFWLRCGVADYPESTVQQSGQRISAAPKSFKPRWGLLIFGFKRFFWRLQRFFSFCLHRLRFFAAYFFLSARASFSFFFHHPSKFFHSFFWGCRLACYRLVSLLWSACYRFVVLLRLVASWLVLRLQSTVTKDRLIAKKKRLERIIENTVYDLSELEMRFKKACVDVPRSVVLEFVSRVKSILIILVSRATVVVIDLRIGWRFYIFFPIYDVVYPVWYVVSFGGYRDAVRKSQQEVESARVAKISHGEFIRRKVMQDLEIERIKREQARVASMSFEEKLVEEVERRQKAIKAELDQMRLAHLFRWQNRIKSFLSWLASPFIRFYAFTLKTSVLLYKLTKKFSWRFWLASVRFVRVVRWIWKDVKRPFRRLFWRYFRTVSWVEAPLYTFNAWVKVIRQILFIIFCFFWINVHTVILIMWSIGGDWKLWGLEVTVDATWDVFMFWLYASHVVAFLIDWYLDPGGFTEWYHQIVRFWTPDPYGGVYEKILKARLKEEKRREKAARAARIKQGLEHTRWRALWVQIMVILEFFLRQWEFVKDFCEAFVMDLRIIRRRLWKNRYEILNMFWRGLTWPFRRSKGFFLRLRDRIRRKWF